MYLNWIKEGYAVVVVVLTLSLLYVIRKRRQQMEAYAAEHGFQFVRKINPADLDLYSTSFFGRFDSAEDVTYGDFQDVPFVHFLQHTSSGHGHKAGYRIIVMFNLGSDATSRGPKPCGHGFVMEVVDGRAFLWRRGQEDPDEDDDEELEQFLARAYAACESVIRKA